MHKDYTSMEAMVRSFGNLGVKCEVCEKLDPYGWFSGASSKPRKFVEAIPPKAMQTWEGNLWYEDSAALKYVKKSRKSVGFLHRKIVKLRVL